VYAAFQTANIVSDSILSYLSLPDFFQTKSRSVYNGAALNR